MSKLNNVELNFVVDRNGEVCSLNSPSDGRSYVATLEDGKAYNATRWSVYKRVRTLNDQKTGVLRLIKLYDLLKSNDNYHWEEKYIAGVTVGKFIRVYDSTTGQLIQTIP